MKNIFKVAVLFATLFIIFSLKPHTAFAKAEDWKDYDVRTKLDGLTAEKIDNYIKSKGHADGALGGIGSTIIDISNKTGINAGVLLGMTINESGWGTSYLSTHFNNFGGVTCKKGYKCEFYKDRQWTVFDSKEHSLRIQAELIMGDMYVKSGRTTIEKVLLRYAPPSDGNNLYGAGGYMDIIGKTIEGLGYSNKGGELIKAEGGSYSNSDGSKSDRKVGSYEMEKFFLEPNYNKSGTTGIDKNANILPSELSYSVQVFSDKTVKILNKIGVFLSALIMLYMTVVLILYIAIFRGYSFNTDLLNKLTKFSEEDNVYSRKTAFKIIGLCIFCTLIMAVFYSNAYVNIMAYIYIQIANLIDYIL